MIFRLLQGVFGASLIPLSQATVLDLFPPQQVGQVMALWGAAAILGPIFGPALGGWLTDNLSWRWVFYINLPIGILAFSGVFLFMKRGGGVKARPFDFIGFGALTVLISAFQLVLDRGPSQDWYSSPEIWTETIVGIVASWIFLVQTLTAARPFFDRALAVDRNFVTCTVFGFFIGILLFSTMALLPPMMQQLMGYPALTSGLVSMPRGLGSFVAMFAVGRLIGRVDTRLILFTGLSLSTLALWQMSKFDLSMGSMPIMISGVIQGLGIGLIFVPLSTLAFATLAPRHRPEATGVYTLMRSLGSSVGISVMQGLWTSNTQVVHSSLAAHIDPSDPVTRAALPPMMSLTNPVRAGSPERRDHAPGGDGRLCRRFSRDDADNARRHAPPVAHADAQIRVGGAPCRRGLGAAVRWPRRRYSPVAPPWVRTSSGRPRRTPRAMRWPGTALPPSRS